MPIPKVLKLLTNALVGIGFAFISFPVKAELASNLVIQGVYQGIQKIHGYQATPRVIFDVPNGAVGACGVLTGSQYCPLNHTVYITRQQIRIAYQHGDAALAYIVAHEYAHAMQTAFGFQPNSTPISELQADCLAGVYLGLIPNMQFDRRDVLEIASFAYRIGDYEWHDANHHGTPEQRVQAVVLGMRSSNQGKNAAKACLF